MAETDVQEYKVAKTTTEQIEHLKENKRVTFDKISENEASELLLRYNYINIISPYKHHFALLDSKKQVVKKDGRHIYELDVDFSEYYSCFLEERKFYPVIMENIYHFEIQFKSIVAYYVLNSYKISNSEELKLYLGKLKMNLSKKKTLYKNRIEHMMDHLDSLFYDVFRYADIYCFFDRMSLGNMLTVYASLDDKLQNKIFNDMKRYKINLKAEQVPVFIDRVFRLVSIRNCVMHCNSLEILIRFYNPKDKALRKSNDRKGYLSLIKELKEKRDK